MDIKRTKVDGAHWKKLQTHRKSLLFNEIPLSFTSLAAHVRERPTDPVIVTAASSQSHTAVLNSSAHSKHVFSLPTQPGVSRYPKVNLKRDSADVLPSASTVLRSKLKRGEGRFKRVALAVKAQMALQDGDGNIKNDLGSLGAAMSALVALRRVAGEDDTEDGMVHVQSTGRKRNRHVQFPPINRKMSVIQFGNRKRSTINFGRMVRELKHTDPSLFNDATLQKALNRETDAAIASRKTSWVIEDLSRSYQSLTKRKSRRSLRKRRRQPRHTNTKLPVLTTQLAAGAGADGK